MTFLHGQIVIAQRRMVLNEERSGLDVRKEFFTQSVVRHSARLPTEAVDIPSLVVLKFRLGGAFSNVL